MKRIVFVSTASTAVAASTLVRNTLTTPSFPIAKGATFKLLGVSYNPVGIDRGNLLCYAASVDLALLDQNGALLNLLPVASYNNQAFNAVAPTAAGCVLENQVGLKVSQWIDAGVISVDPGEQSSTGALISQVNVRAVAALYNLDATNPHSYTAFLTAIYDQ